MLDNQDRAWAPVGNQLVVVSQNGDADNPTFSWDSYDLSLVVPPGDNINSLVPDFNGRILTGEGAAACSSIRVVGSVRLPATIGLGAGG